MKSIIQVASESSFPNCLLQVFIGGGNNAHISHFIFCSSQWSVALGLQHTQQHRLYIFRQVPYLVQEQRTSSSQFKVTFSCCVCTCECTSLMSEESGNGKFRRKRTAIYYLKRLVGSFALQMYLFRYMFFASSVVAQYHNSHVAFSKQFCHFIYTAKLLTFAVNNLVIQLDESFLLVYDFFQTFINYIKQQFLRYIIFRSQFHSPHGTHTFIVRCHDDKWILVAVTTHPFQQVDAVIIPQAHIRNDNIPFRGFPHSFQTISVIVA